jgi:tetratricopeptide (TPR) repeat protein
MTLMSRLLDEALDLDAAGRREWLAALPAQYHELLPVLQEALLRGAASALRPTLATLPKFPAATESAGLTATSPLHAGIRIGPYELLRLLGAGGMAQVWLARRADGAFKRDVALKLPMLNALREDLAERFVRERDILAALEHPYIARLYDAGIDASGLPYLAMEYVPGETLIEWCDTRRLGIAARLELFLQVLQAVQYAHQRHVLHRDLKPSNILVTPTGEVRLLDFGVAKMLEAEDRMPPTQVHGRALTPDYASPELLHGAPVDDRSDVYSLGVLLYELLTGARPYQLHRAASLGLLEHAIATVDPRKPSQQSTQPAALTRATTPQQLTRQLRGDLDAIALKALAKEPAQRYPTVIALANDVRRHLDGKPVEAQPAGSIYRAGKFVRRHRIAVTAIATAVVVTLITVGPVLRERSAQEQTAAALTGALKSKLTMGRQTLRIQRTANTEAYNHYLIGQQLYNRANLEDAKRAVNAYRIAIALDSGYADAYTGLALAESSVGTLTGNDVALHEAVQAADKAIELAPEQAGGYVVRGQLRYLVNWDWTGACADLEKALSYDPGDVTVERKYGELLAAQGHLPQAIAVLEQATGSDPLSSLTWLKLGEVRTVGGQFVAAHAAFRRALEIEPQALPAFYFLGRLELIEGHAGQALADFRSVDTEYQRLSGIAMAEYSLGRTRESQQALDELIAKTAQYAAYQIAEVYAWRGEKNQAFDWLARAYRLRDTGLADVKVDPVLRSLHTDARFLALLARIHLS